jgi:hypothetical protein
MVRWRLWHEAAITFQRAKKHTCVGEQVVSSSRGKKRGPPFGGPAFFLLLLKLLRVFSLVFLELFGLGSD